MNKLISFFLLALALAFSTASLAMDSQHSPASLVRVYINSPDEALPLLKMNLDICSEGFSKSLDILVDATEKEKILDMGYQMEVLIEDVSQHNAQTDGKGYSLYHTYDELATEMQQLATDHPDIVSFNVLGTSLQGRDMMALKVSDNVTQDEPEERAIVFFGNSHAREPMTVEIPFYAMKWLAEAYDSSDPTAVEIVNNLEIWAFPMMNPDGHTYDDWAAHGTQNWWRKNMRDTNDDSDFDDLGYGEGDGVDLNRNYTYMWGYDDYGSSPYWADQTYRGASAGSEPETQAVMNLIEQNEAVIAVSYHQYGELLLMPWGYINDYPDQPFYGIYYEMADGMNNVIDTYHGHTYDIGNAYRTNGNINDWAFGERSGYGFLFEVNSDDDGGFYPDDSLIEPTCQFHYEVIKWLCEWLVDHPTVDVLVSDLNAKPYTNKVELSWRADATEGESILGFNLYRKELAPDITNNPSNKNNDGYYRVNGALITGQNPYSFTDYGLKAETGYDYQLEVVLNDSTSTGATTSTETLSATSFGISSVYPLPADDSATVEFTLDKPGQTTLNLYDLSGRLTTVVLSDNLEAGEHRQTMDTAGLASGLYILELRNDQASTTRAILVSH